MRPVKQSVIPWGVIVPWRHVGACRHRQVLVLPSAPRAMNKAKKKRRLRDALKIHLVRMLVDVRIFGVRVVSSALGMQILLCIEWVKCK
jgi:hypothetical protein